METGVILQYVFGAIVLLIIILYFYAQDSNKKTTKERYSEAMDKLSQDVATTVSNGFHAIVDTDEIKMKKKAISFYNYTIECYLKGTTEYKGEEYKEYDNNHLDLLQITEKEWLIYTKKIFYYGKIKASYYSEKPQDEYMVKYREKSLYDDNFQINIIKDGLNFFSINQYDWIKYGNAVLQMYGIEEDINKWMEQVAAKNKD